MKKGIVLGMVVMAFFVGSALRAGEETPTKEQTGTSAAIEKVEADRVDTVKDATVTETSTSDWLKPLPMTFSIDYTLVSDYIFRGINFSDAGRKRGAVHNEGGRWPNQQLSTGTELDLGKFGRVGGSAWFEWYAGQKYLTPEDGGKQLQEVDYTVYYGYNIEPIGVDAEVGFIWYTFPRVAAGDGAGTQEVYLNMGFDESVWLKALGLKAGKSILNPYLFQAWDMDLAPSGYYGEFGLAPEIALGEVGCKNIPILKDISITPNWHMAWDHNWLNHYTLDSGNGLIGPGNEGRGWASNTSHLMNMVYGGDVKYDLKSALNIPDKYCGALYVKGFLYYSHALARHFLDDQLWGGVSVGYEW
jgi:hypothetical protein